MADSKLVYPKPVSRKPLTGLKRSPADMANARASYGGPMKEMVTTYDNGEKSTPYYDFDLSELTSRTPVKEALRRPKNNATIPTPRRNLKYPDSFDLERGYTGQKGTEKNDAAERQAETLKRMAKGGKVKKFAKGGIFDDPYMGNIMGSHVPGADSSFSALRQKPRTGGSSAGTQSGAAPKNRLDSRMSELDKNLADMKAGKVRLTRGPNGKFQFVSVGSSKPAISKSSTAKSVPSPVRRNAPPLAVTARDGAEVRSRLADYDGYIVTPDSKSIKSSESLLKGFEGVDEAEVPDSKYRSAKELMEGFAGTRGTRLAKDEPLAKGGKVKKFVKGGAVPDGDVQSNRDIGKRDPSLNKRKSTAPFTMKEMEGGLSTEELNKKTRPFDKAKEGKYAAGGKVKKMAGGGMFGSVPVGAAKPPYGGPRPGSVQPKPSMGGKPPYTGPRPGSAQPKPPAVSPGIRKGIGEAVRGGMGVPDMGALARAPKAYGMKEGGKVEKESKGMKCGGMAKYGRGGGIERRGSGAGTVIKGYKSGGMVDGCAQRGKTKGKVC